MLSYHNDSSLKARFVGHVERHRKEDAFLRGTYGDMHGAQFKGCAVGCSIRSLDEIDGRPLRLDNGNHKDLADRLGIPLVLAHLEDRIFEGLPQAEAMLWPSLFAQAIPVGKDLSLIWPRFAHWMLVDPSAGVIRFAKTDQSKTAIDAVAALFARQVAGGVVSLKEWRTARSASADAADAASADAADAAYDAAYAAYDAGSCHFKRMAEKLLLLMSQA
jgi:hypothetical protein